MVTLEQVQLKEILRVPHAICYITKDKSDTLVVKMLNESVPKTQFQELFISIGHIVVKQKITTLVFDMRALRTLQDALLDWYALVWIELMSYHGLTKHRNILPTDERTKAQFEAGISRLRRHHPDANINQVDFRHDVSLPDALAD